MKKFRKSVTKNMAIVVMLCCVLASCARGESEMPKATEAPKATEESKATEAPKITEAPTITEVPEKGALSITLNAPESVVVNEIFEAYVLVCSDLSQNNGNAKERDRAMYSWDHSFIYEENEAMLQQVMALTECNILYQEVSSDANATDVAANCKLAYEAAHREGLLVELCIPYWWDSSDGYYGEVSF